MANWWDNVQSSLWFLPSICLFFAILFSFIIPEIDRIYFDNPDELPSWAFSGSSDGARSILSTIAGSLITVISLLFSITIVVLQQASSQYTPRVLGNFMKQKGNQLVLGVFLATFLYAVLVLRYVRGDSSGGDQFIPVISITFAIFMATVCLGLLIYFVHRTATSLQASSVVANAQHELETSIQSLYPEHLGDPVPEIPRTLDRFREEHGTGPSGIIYAQKSGYLRSVDDDVLAYYLAPQTSWAIVYPPVGEFVVRGTPLIEVGGTAILEQDFIDNITGAFILNTERSLHQDPLFGFRQLADIGLKAMSPGVNDPTTAENALQSMADVLAHLADREFPDPVRIISSPKDGHYVYLWVNGPTYGDFVEEAFGQLRREVSKSNWHVTKQILILIRDIGRNVKTFDRAEPLRAQVDEILRAIDSASYSEKDREDIRRCAVESRDGLPV